MASARQPTSARRMKLNSTKGPNRTSSMAVTGAGGAQQRAEAASGV
jgi:hypothetical protein